MAGTSNAQKTHFAREMNVFAEAKAQQAINLLGKALPASVTAVAGSIVTVKFEVKSQFTIPNVTVPLFGPEYIRYPIQVGCKGLVFPADASIAAMCGLGKGMATLGLQANLSSLVFFPIGNKDFSESDDPNRLILYGPDGAVLRSMNKKAQAIATDASLTLKFGDIASIVLTEFGVEIHGPITIYDSVTGNEGVINFGGSSLVTLGEMTAGGVGVSTHKHTGVQTGGGDTGPPIP